MARAPGRLDVMGGIADYSGSLVLQARATRCGNVHKPPAAAAMLHSSAPHCGSCQPWAED